MICNPVYFRNSNIFNCKSSKLRNFKLQIVKTIEFSIVYLMNGTIKKNVPHYLANFDFRNACICTWHVFWIADIFGGINSN